MDLEVYRKILKVNIDICIKLFQNVDFEICNMKNMKSNKIFLTSTININTCT